MEPAGGPKAEITAAEAQARQVSEDGVFSPDVHVMDAEAYLRKDSGLKLTESPLVRRRNGARAAAVSVVRSFLTLLARVFASSLACLPQPRQCQLKIPIGRPVTWKKLMKESGRFQAAQEKKKKREKNANSICVTTVYELF